MNGYSTAWAGCAAVSLSLASCAHRSGDNFNPPVPGSYVTSKSAGDFDFVRDARAPRSSPDQVGLATWYGQAFAGKKTANGERFDPSAMTAAHRSLPLGTWIDVRRPDTGRSVRVRINDRGPYADRRRIVDLSYQAAERLDVIRQGAVRVELRVVRGP